MHHSIVLFLQPTLMHNSITTCMSHYYPRHVSGLDVPILRRNNCTNRTSGVLALTSGCTLHRLRADSAESACLAWCERLLLVAATDSSTTTTTTTTSTHTHTHTHTARARSECTVSMPSAWVMTTCQSPRNLDRAHLSQLQ